ncbi:MAG TPA: GNAT family N-acetyltransferase [Candidatus Limiplasma sp.]|nr:GNAT family N-acetyltransferase [Candidatus Limiplasma sp.]HRX07673.1 GNAT family N-acetyltransferase [Candidatus Limiplasma sp.]
MPKDLFAQYPRLQSERLILRKLEPEDAQDLFAIYSDETLFRYTPGSPRKTLAAVQSMIGHFARDFTKRKTLFLGICLRSRPENVVGIAEMFDFDSKVSAVTIGYRLHADFWGMGIATEAVRMMADYLLNAIGIARIQAFVMPENTRSHAVLLRNGFQKEGTIRQGYVWTGRGVVDLTVYSLLHTDAR